MEEPAPVVWVWSNSTPLPPDRMRVYPLTFAGVALCVFVVAALAVFSLLAIIPPGASSATFGRWFTTGLQVVAWKASAGILWSSHAPAVLADIARSGNGGTIAAKAILAAVVAPFPAWYCSRGALDPQDGHRHIKGGRLYDGDVAMKKLAKTLASKDKD